MNWIFKTEELKKYLLISGFVDIPTSGLHKSYKGEGNRKFMKVKELIGKKVYDKDAIEIGKISDLDIDISNFTVEKIYIKSGMTKHHEVSPENIDRLGDTVILKSAKGEL